MLDPGRKEEAAAAGRLTVVVNAHQEVCAVQKLDGVALPPVAVRPLLRSRPESCHIPPEQPLVFS